jgi:hypothetical protein
MEVAFWTPGQSDAVSQVAYTALTWDFSRPNAFAAPYSLAMIESL